MQGTPIGFLDLTVQTSIPMKGGGIDAIAFDERLDIPAGFNSVDLHVILSAATATYGVLRYWPQDDAWRLERGLSSFGPLAAASSNDPLSIPSDRAMSLAIYRDVALSGGTEYATLSCTVR